MSIPDDRPKIVFYDATPDDRAYFTRELASIFNVVATKEPLTQDNAHLARDAHAISFFVTSTAPASVLDQMPQLRYISCRSAGIDKVDTDYAASHDIIVSNVPAYGPETVAEFAFLLLLATSRKLVPLVRAASDGDMSHETYVGHELFAKKLGVIGTGRIGQHAARLGVGFGMKVTAYDPYRNDKAAGEIGFSYVSLPALLETADFITLHAPATSDSVHLLDQASFGVMKRGVVVVNTARGSLIDTQALLVALKSGQVGAAGLDVIEHEEVLSVDSDDHSPEAKSTRHIVAQLANMPNVVMTHHNAFNTYEAVESIRKTTKDNIISWQAGDPHNKVA